MKPFADQSYDVIVCGGGIAGLVTALALGIQGKNILICEKGAKINTNGADVLKPSGIKILEELGLLPALLKAEARQRHEVAFFHNGDLAKTVDYRIHHSTNHFYLVPYQEVVRAVLEAAQAVSTITIRLNTELTDIEQDAQGNVCRVQLRQQDTYTYCEAPVVVGADGIHSRLRSLLGIQAQIEPYAQAMYFGKFSLVPSVDEKNRLYVDTKGALAYFYPISYSHFRAVLSFPDEEAVYFIKGNRTNELKKRLQDFVTASDDALEAIDTLANFVTFPLCRMNLSCYDHHNVVFLGNAAHAIHPISGQGMNLAIEDAAELCEQLMAYFSGTVSLNEALRIFSEKRHPVSQALSQYAHQLAGSFGNREQFLASLNPNLQASSRTTHDLNAVAL